jgi:hypothetical protein
MISFRRIGLWTATALLGVLALGTPAQGQVPLVPIAPADNEVFQANKFFDFGVGGFARISFRFEADFGGPHGCSYDAVILSTSRAVIESPTPPSAEGSDGTSIDAACELSNGITYFTVPETIARPDLYYWRPYAYRCLPPGSGDCDIFGPIRSFRIVPDLSMTTREAKSYAITITQTRTRWRVYRVNCQRENSARFRCETRSSYGNRVFGMRISIWNIKDPNGRYAAVRFSVTAKYRIR